MSLFNRQRRAWRSLPKRDRLKAPTWFTISVDTSSLPAFQSVEDFMAMDGDIPGLRRCEPFTIEGTWGEPEPAFSFPAEPVGGRMPRRMKKALRKWQVGLDLAQGERDVLRCTRWIPTGPITVGSAAVD